jgi:riboflavin-specific deaminase-like protein
MLRRAGITVDIAEDDLPFWVTNAAFNTAQALGRPYVHLKWAQSLDGCLATSSGDSKWLSDETARTEAHALRAACDGVLVGSGTLSADNPRLTVRWIEARSPVPLVLDSELSISLDSNLVRERAAELVVLTTEGADPARRAALEERGVTLLVPDGGLTPSSILDSLWDLGMRSVLVEGGAAVISSFLGSELYDRVSVFTAPVFLGGDCVSLGDLGIERVAHAPRLELVTQKVVNDQILTEGFRPGWRRQTHESVEERNVYGAR